MKVPLSRIAHARSGDKGDLSNVGVIALAPACYPALVREVTVDRVRDLFGPLCRGAIERFEMPHIGAMNFLLHDALGGGGTVSLRLDAQGKTLGALMLTLEVNVEESELA